MTADDLLQKLHDRVRSCQLCELAKTRHNVVFGEGNPYSNIVFVGEAPGEDEDWSGNPFVGRAGQLLNRGFEASPLKRSDIYICNILKCRPPKNAVPTSEQQKCCRTILEIQIRIINPDILVAVGRTAAECLTGTKIPSMARCSKSFKVNVSGRARIVVPITHPAYYLRNQVNGITPLIADLKEVYEISVQFSKNRLDESVEKWIETSFSCEEKKDAIH